MNDILVSIQLGLQIATTAVIAVAVLIVSIALVYQAIDIARAVIDRADGGYLTEEEEEAYQEYLWRHSSK